MLKLRWPRKAKTGDREAGAAVEASSSSGVETTPDGGATEAQPETRIRESLEMIKTALVWLVVINILTALAPLLWLPLKWTIAVYVLLTVSSIVVGCVAYLRAARTQRRLPE